MTPEGPDSNTEQDLANLSDKWETVKAKITERKVESHCMAFTTFSLMIYHLGPSEGSLTYTWASTVQLKAFNRSPHNEGCSVGAGSDTQDVVTL